jgi:hypothetical protein
MARTLVLGAEVEIQVGEIHIILLGVHPEVPVKKS